jgi:hypothetical protein
MIDHVARTKAAAAAILKVVPQGYGMTEIEATDYARAALAAADAVTAETHWLAPNEPTAAMETAARAVDPGVINDEYADAETHYRAMRGAYLAESEAS